MEVHVLERIEGSRRAEFEPVRGLTHELSADSNLQAISIREYSIPQLRSLGLRSLSYNKRLKTGPGETKRCRDLRLVLLSAVTTVQRRKLDTVFASASWIQRKERFTTVHSYCHAGQRRRSARTPNGRMKFPSRHAQRYTLTITVDPPLWTCRCRLLRWFRDEPAMIMR